MRILWVSLLLAGLCLAKEEESGDNLQEIEGKAFESSSSSGGPTCNGCSSSSGGKPSSSSSVIVPDLNTLLNKPVLNTNFGAGALDSVTDDVLLKIGDVISFFNSLGTQDPLAQNQLLTGNLDNLDIHGIEGLSSMAGLTGLSSMAGLTGITGLAGLGAIDGGSGAIGKFFSVLNLLKAGLLDLGVRGLEIANFVLAIIGLALIIAYVVENDGSLGVLGFGLTGSGYGSGSASGSSSGSGSYARSFMDSPVAEGLTNLVYEAISKYD